MTPYRFFYRNAGFAWGEGETKAQGRARGARALAAAEAWMQENGAVYQWKHDGTASAEFTGKKPGYALWECCMYQVIDNELVFVESLGGIDFGENGEPWGNDYRRVVEAELALDHKETRHE